MPEDIAQVSPSAAFMLERGLLSRVPISGGIKFNIYDLTYVYFHGSGVKNATACSAF